MRFIIEQGYISGSNGWTASENGSLYAVIKVDENNNQLGEADAVLEIDDILKAIKKLMEVK